MKTGRAASLAGGYLFLVPYLLLFAVFLIFPLIYGLQLSFTKYELASPEMVSHRRPPFAGLANYSEALHDPYFWKALKATSIFVVFSVPIVIVTALAFAVGIEAIPGKRQSVYQLAVFLPTMITISVAGILWRWFYNSEFGLFNAAGTEDSCEQNPLAPDAALGHGVDHPDDALVDGRRTYGHSPCGFEADSQFLLRSGGDRRRCRLAAILVDHASPPAAGVAVRHGH